MRWLLLLALACDAPPDPPKSEVKTGVCRFDGQVDAVGCNENGCVVCFRGISGSQCRTIYTWECRP